MGRESSGKFEENLAPLIGDTMTLGSSIAWESYDTHQFVTFTNVPWATAVSHDYTAGSGAWWWEYGFTLDTIYDAEEIRDHLFQAIYGSFFNLKQQSMYATSDLYWVGLYRRQTRVPPPDRRLLLTQSDVLHRRVLRTGW